MGADCNICTANIKQQNYALECAGLCKNVFHAKCVNVSNKDCLVLNSIKNVKWFCDNCAVFSDFTKQLHKDVAEVKNVVNKFYNKTVEPKLVKSYAEVASDVVVIKPKVGSDSKVTKEDILKNIKPAELQVCITKIKNIKDGGILIGCSSKEELDKFKSAAEKKLKKNYNIKIPQLKNPCIKILDIEDTMDEDELKKYICKQNSYLQHENFFIEIKVIKKMKSRYMAIAETDPLSFKKIIENGKLSIGWNICRVFEYVRVYRCFNCGGFDHRANECKVGQICLKCTSADHNTEKCEINRFTCLNCVSAKNKLKLNLNTDHSMFDMNCPCLQRKIDAERRNTKYNHE